MSLPDPARPAPKPWISWLTGPEGRFAMAELAAGLFLLGELVALVLYHDRLSNFSALVLWVQWLGTVVALRAAGFFTLFGPVLFYELIRASRRPRYIIIRTLYATALMLLLGWVAFIWYMEGTGSRGHVEAKQMAAFAETFFFVFAVVQGMVVIILTPAYTGGAIADEKDRRTLDFLLATSLNKREIVFGKLVSRIANLSMMILAGLPILSFLQFMGGVDPNLVLATFVATFATMFSLAGVSMFFSVQLRKSRDAIALTYITYAAYLAISTFLSIFLMIGGPVIGAWGGFPSNVLGFESPVTIADVVHFMGSGNIIACVFQLGMAMGGRMGPPAHELMPELLRGYVGFHLVFAILPPLYATLRLRSIALREKEEGARKLGVLRTATRPRIGVFPMIWKEVFAEPGLKLNWLGRIIVLLIVLCSYVPAFFIVEYFFERLPPEQWPAVPFQLLGNWLENESRVVQWFLTGVQGNAWNNGRNWQDPYWGMAQGMNIWARIAGSAVATLLLLSVGVRAAGSVSGEREKATLDELLTTPLSAHSIIFAKWLGAILSVRWSLLWLLGLWLIAILGGGMSVFAVPVVLLSLFIYIAVAAGIGLCFSSWCRKTLSATVWTLATLLFAGGLHWLLAAVIVYVPLSFVRTHDLMEWFAKLEFGQTPPLVMGMFTFWRYDFEWGMFNRRHEEFEWIACCVAGLFVWTVAAVILYAYAYSLFAAMANRLPYLRPVMPPRPQPVSLRKTTRPAPSTNGHAILTVLPAEEPTLMVLPAEESDERVRSDRT
jgi:ABC-type transport system involved in multi-copper enzyme maturation permease subunit